MISLWTGTEEGSDSVRREIGRSKMADSEEPSAKLEQGKISRGIDRALTSKISSSAVTSWEGDHDSERQMEPQVSGLFRSLMASVRSCHYEMAEYFVAWQGVLTAACSGVPPPLCQLKREISSQLEGIAPENPGSKWPKTSLGCLRDQKTLSLEQLRILRRICSEESRFLAATPPVLVDDLSVVLYANCCLEKIITVATTPLKFPADSSEPTNEERKLVQNVLNEFSVSNIENYHLFTSKPGNRSAHYRSFKPGATVVHFLKSIPDSFVTFRARVDKELPGMYDWFRDDSLHITLRALF